MRHDIHTYVIRTGMIIFWVMSIAACLYIPSLWHSTHEKKTISIATWPLLIDPHIVKAFEQETGIKVEIAYFERTEELFAKIKATGGKGYDIIFPSDHTVKLMIEENLLLPIDHARLDFWSDLDPRLLGTYYDPLNKYSIPFYWGVIALGINTKFFATPPAASWSLIFDAAYSHLPLLMTDQAREAIFAASRYLYGSSTMLQDPAAQQAVKQLLIEQKKWVTMYSTERVDDMLASENCAIAFGMASDIIRARLHNPHIQLTIPKEGTFLVVDAIALTQSARTDLVYTFINYLYRQEVMLHHMRTYAMCSPLASLNKDDACSDIDFTKLEFLTNILSEDTFNTIWVDLLAH